MTRKTTLRIIFFPYLFILFFSCSYHCQGEKGKRDGEVKGMFVFGSSLVDNGNNNFLAKAMAKANYFPYGIDFPLGPTGRFTNGKNVIDILGEYLHLPHIPPFYDPFTKGHKIVHGVDYASGGSGIRDDTGSIARNVASLNRQIRNFEKVTLPKLKAELDCRGDSHLSLANYLFVVGSGGNDYLLNYFRNPSNQVSLQNFTANLTATLSHQLKKLYGLGARKVVLISVNPLGCSPAVRARNEGQCKEEMNQAAQMFNVKLKSLVDDMKSEMPGSNLVFLNSYKILMDIISDPASKGFKNAVGHCCEVMSKVGNGILCKIKGKTCRNRRKYVFFDGLHPTEAVNEHIASKAYASQLKAEVYPINVQQLANL